MNLRTTLSWTRLVRAASKADAADDVAGELNVGLHFVDADVDSLADLFANFHIHDPADSFSDSEIDAAANDYGKSYEYIYGYIVAISDDVAVPDPKTWVHVVASDDDSDSSDSICIASCIWRWWLTRFQNFR